MTAHPLSPQEREVLQRVSEGAFDGATLIPEPLGRLIGFGLVEACPVALMPPIPNRYRYRLTAAGKACLNG